MSDFASLTRTSDGKQVLVYFDVADDGKGFVMKQRMMIDERGIELTIRFPANPSIEVMQQMLWSMNVLKADQIQRAMLHQIGLQPRQMQ